VTTSTWPISEAAKRAVKPPCRVMSHHEALKVSLVRRPPLGQGQHWALLRAKDLSVEVRSEVLGRALRKVWIGPHEALNGS
jgi:hypothetical protein